MAVVAVTDHVFRNLDTERALLAAAGHELRFSGNATTPEEVRAVVRGAEAILNCYAKIPNDLLQELVGCRIIARYGIGLDTVDVSVATARGILVSNVPDYCLDEVSDHALALVLALARGVARFDRDVRAGSWAATGAGTLHRLQGRTLGLVGFGRIARRLAHKASAIGFRIVACDPYVPAAEMEAAGVAHRELDALLAEADVVSLHAPVTDQSRHMIGEREFTLMRPGAVLINTARGSLVDLEALTRALVEGHLSGAGLDVLDPEPPAPDHPLLQRPDVVITPHAAFYSEESLAELQRKAAEQVVAALAGEIPPYAVNPDAVGFRSP